MNNHDSIGKNVTPFCDSIWLDTAPVSILGMKLTAIMDVLQLPDGGLGRPTHWWTVWYATLMGFYDRVAISRMIRWTAFTDHAAARRSLDELLALPFDRLVVGHGAPLTSGAREALIRAYGWLPETTRRASPG